MGEKVYCRLPTNGHFLPFCSLAVRLAFKAETKLRYEPPVNRGAGPKLLNTVSSKKHIDIWICSYKACHTTTLRILLGDYFIESIYSKKSFNCLLLVIYTAHPCYCKNTHKSEALSLSLLELSQLRTSQSTHIPQSEKNRDDEVSTSSESLTEDLLI